ncbi:hypothetical protein C5E10_13270 [Pseudoclavibacter sp. RFBG4]|uniref:hypothetical protein n=1 Tax=Pseudoclavibacter sp. RFBG4 TaxID=2080575 RepID=UPI000CE74B9D|nr:hypothetical protein [Pseudoclavibacter sp. RFBG4]PPG28564.1 hypothetical protein C5E10_13270 [Pseudoclavibacter sp. RFBG4]
MLNAYSRDVSVFAEQPQSPWAMYLATDAGAYRFLCFDLDASRGNTVYDAGKLTLWLNELGIDHVLTKSGPSEGRHVWLALEDEASAETVRELAQLAAQLFPSLDPTPLMNPRTGCVRPPGSPHRNGDSSRPAGPIDALLDPSVTPDQVRELRAFLIDAGAEELAPVTSLTKGMVVDADGYPHITGTRRPLSARVRLVLDTPPADDASYALATVLAGCANARWTLAEVRELVDDAPGFEHVRSQRHKHGHRIPRTPQGRERALVSAWRHAITYVAANPSTGDGSDEGFLTRCAATVEAVDAAQVRANAMPGLWGGDRASSSQRSRTGTHSTRAVLDALCLYMAQAAQLTIEADVRRISADTGYGRTTVHEALRRLATPTDEASPESAWIVREGTPEGAHAQRYRLSRKFSTETQANNRTQVLARPGAALPLQARTQHIARLAKNLQALAHDAFTAPHSFGRTTGLVYKYVDEGSVVTVDDLTRSTGLDAARTRTALRTLHAHGLLQRLDQGWTRGEQSTVEAAARMFGVAGHLEARRARYTEERHCWAWWQAEVQWMSRRGKRRRRRRPPTAAQLLSVSDRPEYPRYPRNAGRGDHRLALALVRAGSIDVPVLRAA